MKVTTIGSKGIALIQHFEGFYSKPYICPAGVPSIGWGTTVYPNGKKVSMSDAAINEAKAVEYLKHDLKGAERDVDRYTVDTINQNQFDALVSFVYNCGVGNFSTSTLLKKVNKNPLDPTIAAEFAKWVYGGGKKLKGLEKRRAKESELYFDMVVC